MHIVSRPCTSNLKHLLEEDSIMKYENKKYEFYGNLAEEDLMRFTFSFEDTYQRQSWSIVLDRDRQVMIHTSIE
ncbi:hypothetical protein CRG98_011349 [Punica granatum]|uniref:Uncharacterized protein n=1 Tax=Punica granatum TaxID=22663 RepID=A0A2I0KIJ1_PUNGR|nr:hypothetical protein CRG98_011349 [Punica granatum]